MIRGAKISDAKAIAELVLVILQDMELPFVTKYGPEVTLQVLAAGVAEPRYRYGYQRGIVKEIDGAVAGIAFGYPAKDEPTIDEPLGPILAQHGIDPATRLFTDPETFPAEWYLDTISVAKAYRGQGIGTELLQALPEVVQQTGENTIGLSVDEANPQAEKLYQRMGFKTVGEKMISGHRYQHMQKEI